MRPRAAAAILLAFAAGSSAAAPHTYTIVIDKLKFGPAPKELRAGDMVVWINNDMFRHSATARDNSFNVDLPAGKTAKIVLKRPGAIRFYCKYHPGMTGTFLVRA